jgi:hypothetical protein
MRDGNFFCTAQAAAGRARSRSSLQTHAGRGESLPHTPTYCLLLCTMYLTNILMRFRFTQVFYLDATNKATIKQSYKEIASQMA